MQLPAHIEKSGGLPQNSVPAFELIDDELSRVKRLIYEQLGDCPDKVGLDRALSHPGSCSGKMLRPGLVLLTGVLFGGITDRHIHIAAVAEMIHNAALLHDDVIDEGRKRRGRPTVNTLWGNEFAVLLGDFLLSKVFQMCAGLEPEVAGIIAATALRTCEGELRQIVQRQNWRLSESEYIEIITEKSAVLFSCCCRLGGLLAEAGENEVRAMADFGLNVGIAFQIVDDLLDITGDEGKTGKTLGSDVDKNKLTLPVIHLLRTMDEEKKAAVIDFLSPTQKAHRRKGRMQSAKPDMQYSKESFVEMLNSYGSLKYAHSRAQEFVAKAIAALSNIRDGEAKDALIETAKFAGRRVV